MKRVVFIGSKEPGLAVLKKLHQLDSSSLAGCITIDDSGDTRSCLGQFDAFCTQNAVKIEVLTKAKGLSSAIAGMKPDVCFVSGWYFLIDQKTIDSVPMGMVGIHHSLLPAYRGFAPLVWAMINGEKEAGFSLFRICEQMDEGDIWASGTVEILHGDYISDVIKKVNASVLELLERTYASILNGNIKPKKQDGAPIYCAKRIPEDGQIDWKKPASDIYNFIRAQAHPYPGAFTIYKERRLYIKKAVEYGGTYYGTPGQIGQIFEDGALVICGDSKGILLTEAEYDGKELCAREILHSLNIRL
ncbi:MAG: methionyl-tRNA formyltransferase [Eubacterium sp.]|nr:methionyl-tRNA formyltransferase [Eubacterium sp.]